MQKHIFKPSGFDPTLCAVDIGPPGRYTPCCNYAADDAHDLTHFATFTIRPLNVIVKTAEPAESPPDYQDAQRIFEHIHGHLITACRQIESELPPRWFIEVQEAQD